MPAAPVAKENSVGFAIEEDLSPPSCSPSIRPIPAPLWRRVTGACRPGSASARQSTVSPQAPRVALLITGLGRNRVDTVRGHHRIAAGDQPELRRRYAGPVGVDRRRARLWARSIPGPAARSAGEQPCGRPVAGGESAPAGRDAGARADGGGHRRQRQRTLPGRCRRLAADPGARAGPGAGGDRAAGDRAAHPSRRTRRS